MPFVPVGGIGTGGAGGLTLGPPTNTFTAATQAAAETARDTYATANPDWLAQYDAEADLHDLNQLACRCNGYGLSGAAILSMGGYNSDHSRP